MITPLLLRLLLLLLWQLCVRAGGCGLLLQECCQLCLPGLLLSQQLRQG
jgi:hypothetical protein